MGGATEFFKSFQKSGDQEASIFHALETHPALHERIERIAKMARAQGYRQAQTLPLPALVPSSTKPR